jgi:hypothetical protein
MAGIPPGIRWLIPRLKYLLAPPLFVFVFLHHLQRRTDTPPLPKWLLALSMACSVPGALLAWSAWTDAVHSVRARRNGAVRPPLVRNGVGHGLLTWVPGGLGLLRKLVSSFEEGYPGAWPTGRDYLCSLIARG